MQKTIQPLSDWRSKYTCKSHTAETNWLQLALLLCAFKPSPPEKTQPNSSLCVCVCLFEREYVSVHVPQSPTLICRGFAASTAAKTLRADPDHRRKNEAGSERRPRTPPQLPRQAGELGVKRHRLYLWSANTDHLPYVHRGSAAPLARPLGPGSAASA